MPVVSTSIYVFLLCNSFDMKLLMLLAFIVFSSLFTIGQDRSGIYKNEKTDQEAYSEGSKEKLKALIIPFEPKMYMSGIDRDLAMKTGMTFQQIRDNMRFGLTNVLLTDMHRKMSCISLMHVDTGSIDKELAYIYSSIGYKYKEIPKEQLLTAEEIKPDKDAAPIVKAKFKINHFVGNVKEKVSSIGEAEEVEEKDFSGVNNGEIVTTYSQSEKYIATSIHNPNLLTQLNSKFEVTVFIFINQLDIEKAAHPTQKGLATDSYKRKIKVHYTIFNLDGTEISSGACLSYFSSKNNDMNVIIKTHFASIASSISATVIPKEEEKVKKADTRSDLEKY